MSYNDATQMLLGMRSVVYLDDNSLNNHTGFPLLVLGQTASLHSLISRRLNQERVSCSTQVFIILNSDASDKVLRSKDVGFPEKGAPMQLKRDMAQVSMLSHGAATTPPTFRKGLGHRVTHSDLKND